MAPWRWAVALLAVLAGAVLSVLIWVLELFA